MAKIMLITGGCRSGKSRYAQQIAEDAGEKRLFIATAPVLDKEMEHRVAQHQEMRRGRGWKTIEETLDLTGCLNQADKYDVVLCDCLTLWVSNLLFNASNNDSILTEENIIELCREISVSAQNTSALVLFVTNEVGLGIVPENQTARRFRDLAGRCNQEMAAVADSVSLLTCGIPLQLKGTKNGKY